jgi:dTDP-4-amino-4,6-dideoxygalactose transaminase
MTPDLFVPAFTTLRPGMLLKRRRRNQPYPFSSPRARYFYFARHGLWRLVKMLNLERREVLVPSYHHGVEIEALMDAGARLSFYRVGRHMEVDLDDVERKIGPATAALHLTHFVGFPGPVAEMKAIAERHGLILIEDCAHALLTRVNNEPLGQTGDVSLFCLYKGLPVPNGGAIVINNPRFGNLPRLAAPPTSSTMSLMASSMLRNIALRGGKPGRALRQWALRLGKQTLRASKIDPVRTGSEHFNRDHVSLGMTRLAMRIALSHDLTLTGRVMRRNYLFLEGKLADISPPLLPPPAPGVAPFFYPLVVDDNKTVVDELNKHGIEAVDFWRGPHPACDIRQFPDVAWLRRSVVEIPCHQDISLSTLGRVSDIVHDVLKKRPRRSAA